MIAIIVEPLPEGVWLATSPDLPGLIVEMPTKDEAVAVARETAGELLLMDLQKQLTGSGGTTGDPPKLVPIG